jgi:site-specific recombinase
LRAPVGSSSDTNATFNRAKSRTQWKKFSAVLPIRTPIRGFCSPCWWTKSGPPVGDDCETARRNLQALCYILSTRPELRAALRAAFSRLARDYRHSELYTATGILPNTGFVSEACRRIGHKFLPEVLDPGLLRTLLRRVFDRPSDRQWVIGVGDDTWLKLIDALRFAEDPPSTTLPQSLIELLHSLRVLSYWIVACGMEPELLRLEPALETHESPFVAQNRELTAYIDSYPEQLAKTGDARHRRRAAARPLQSVPGGH